MSPALPDDTAWLSVDHLPPMAFDHGRIVDRAHDRLRGKLSYTNIAFALAPAEFTIAELSRIYFAVLGHHVDPTNLQRILTRRGMLERTGGSAAPGPGGGRPAAQYRFATRELRVTDPFAAFRPPDSCQVIRRGLDLGVVDLRIRLGVCVTDRHRPDPGPEEPALRWLLGAAGLPLAGIRRQLALLGQHAEAPLERQWAVPSSSHRESGGTAAGLLGNAAPSGTPPGRGWPSSRSI